MGGENRLVVVKRWRRSVTAGSTGSYVTTIPKRLLDRLRLLGSDVECLWSLNDDNSVSVVFRPRIHV